MTTAYDSANALPELVFIAGTDKLLTFTCYQENTNLLNITSGTVVWLLCPYGQFNTTTLQKQTGGDGVVINTANTFQVTLDAADTLALSGKYIQQVSITDFSGNTFRPSQGVVIILPAIPET
jgi:hypothetical protein